MPPTLLRQFWNFVEQTQTGILLGLDDSALCQWLVVQFTRQQGLEPSQVACLRDYAAARINLIRDMAQDRSQHFLIGLA